MKNKKTGNISTICKLCKNEYTRLHSKLEHVKLRRREQKKLYWLENKEILRPKRTIYMRNRRRTDINFKLASVLRTRISNILKSGKGSGNGHISFLGCSIDDLKIYLQKQFKPGMSWENYGRKGWNIDHIKPISKFDLTDEQNMKLVCHYTNLQPLWVFENLIKRNN